MAKEKKVTKVTPVGEAAWAYLNKPKAPFQGDASKGSKYQIDIVFDPTEPAWVAWLANLRDAYAALPGDKTKRQSPVKAEVDGNGHETGRKFFTAKTGEQFKPRVFDRQGQPMPPEVIVGNGSKVRVSYIENVYDGFGGGINFYLNAVQVMELVEYAGRDAGGYGFDIETAPPAGRNDDIPF